MHVGAVPDANRPERAGGDPDIHVGAGPDAMWAGGSGWVPYMHVGAGPDAHRPEGAVGGRWGPVHARVSRSGRPQA